MVLCFEISNIVNCFYLYLLGLFYIICIIDMRCFMLFLYYVILIFFLFSNIWLLERGIFCFYFRGNKVIVRVFIIVFIYFDIGGYIVFKVEG